jgi:hypothetical protein
MVGQAIAHRTPLQFGGLTPNQAKHQGPWQVQPTRIYVLKLNIAFATALVILCN